MSTASMTRIDAVALWSCQCVGANQQTGEKRGRTDLHLSQSADLAGTRLPVDSLLQTGHLIHHGGWCGLLC